MVSLGCGCQFCDEVSIGDGPLYNYCCPVQCLGQYTRGEVLAASYSISCPDPGCQHTVSAACLTRVQHNVTRVQGTISQAQLSSLLPPDLMDKHRQFRLETEVSQ